VADGDQDRARALSEDALALADSLKKNP
jgi:hypothetical protein